MYKPYTEPSAPAVIDSPPTYDQAVGVEPASAQSKQEAQTPVITTQPSFASTNQVVNLSSDDNASQNSETRRRRREANAFYLDCCTYNENDCYCAYLLCKYTCHPFGQCLANCCQCTSDNPDGGGSPDSNCCDCECNDCDECGCGDCDCSGCDCGDCDCSGCDCGDCDCSGCDCGGCDCGGCDCGGCVGNF